MVIPYSLTVNILFSEQQVRKKGTISLMYVWKQAWKSKSLHVFGLFFARWDLTLSITEGCNNDESGCHLGTLKHIWENCKSKLEQEQK